MPVIFGIELLISTTRLLGAEETSGRGAKASCLQRATLHDISSPSELLN